MLGELSIAKTVVLMALNNSSLQTKAPSIYVLLHSYYDQSKIPKIIIKMPIPVDHLARCLSSLRSWTFR